MIKKGKLKNEELLDLIENEEIFLNKTNNQKLELNVYAFRGFDINSMNEKFFEKWNKINFFQKYSFSKKDFYSEISDKINHMKDFGKLLKLLYFENEIIFDKEKGIKDLFINIYDKYIKLLRTYTSKTCPNFKKETSLLIYTLNKVDLKLSIQLMKNIDKYFNSSEIESDIYLYLITNYNSISNDIVEYIANHFIINKEIDNLLIVFSNSILESVLNKMSIYSIKEEEIFKDEKEFDSFKLLKGIQERFNEKYELFMPSDYMLSNVRLTNKIFKNIKIGEIQYNLVNSYYMNPIKSKILFSKLNILFFQNEKDAKTCIEIIEKYNSKIYQVTKYIEKVNEMLSLQNDIKNDECEMLGDIQMLEKEIKNGKLNIIDKKEIKEKINKIHQLIPDLKKVEQLKTLIIFLQMFHNKILDNILTKGIDILREKEIDLKQLKLLFAENWNKLDINTLENVLHFLKDDFKIDNLNIAKLKKEMLSEKKFNCNFEISNNYFNYIVDKNKNKDLIDENNKKLNNLIGELNIRK